MNHDYLQGGVQRAGGAPSGCPGGCIDYNDCKFTDCDTLTVLLTPVCICVNSLSCPCPVVVAQYESELIFTRVLPDPVGGNPTWEYTNGDGTSTIQYSDICGWISGIIDPHWPGQDSCTGGSEGDTDNQWYINNNGCQSPGNPGCETFGSALFTFCDNVDLCGDPVPPCDNIEVEVARITVNTSCNNSQCDCAGFSLWISICGVAP